MGMIRIGGSTERESCMRIESVWHSSRLKVSTRAAPHDTAPALFNVAVFGTGTDNSRWAGSYCPEGHRAPIRARGASAETDYAAALGRAAIRSYQA